MKTAYFDCFSGISGDMVLGALVDAGVELGRLEAELRRLPLPGWKLSAEKVRKGAIAATKVNVETEEQHHHRTLTTILKLIDSAELAPRVAERARKIFEKLGQAEAKVHGIPIEKVHFHEVGAVDAIIDIVGASIGFEMLGFEEFATSPLNLGGGRVETAHGTLPVPAPATISSGALPKHAAARGASFSRQKTEVKTGVAVTPPLWANAVYVSTRARRRARQPRRATSR